MATRRSRRRHCAHLRDPRTCPRCAVGRWRLLLASTRLVRAAKHLTPYSERSEWDQLQRCLDRYHYAVGYYRSGVAPEASERRFRRVLARVTARRDPLDTDPDTNGEAR